LKLRLTRWAPAEETTKDVGTKGSFIINIF